MEETKEKLSAKVKSPCMDAHERHGNGFSLAEIKAAGKTVELLKQLNVKIDFFRRSMHQENVELLQSLEPPKRKGKKRKPFTPKEKKIKAKPFKMKKKMMPAKAKKPAVKAPAKKAPAKKLTAKKPKAKAAAKVTTDEILLTKLSGMGPATAKKFNEIGVTTVKQLVKENPTELAMLVKGASEDRIKKWVEEGKKLLKK